MPEILNSKEAAELMRLSVQTIRSMAASGEIPGMQIGDDWRFLQSQLIDYVASKSITEQRRRQEQSEAKKYLQLAMSSSNETPVKRARGRPSKKVDLSAYQ